MGNAYDKLKAEESERLHRDFPDKRFMSYTYFVVGSREGMLSEVCGHQLHETVYEWDLQYGDPPGHPEYKIDMGVNEAKLIDEQECALQWTEERDFEYNEEFTYRGYVYSLEPFLYLKYLKPICKVLAYLFTNPKTKDVANIVFFEDAAGDSLGIASHGSVEQRQAWHDEYHEDGKGPKYLFSLESIMIKTASPFGDF